MGPFCLLGYSFGALVMLEVAQRLEKMGSPPAHLFVAAEAAPEDVIPAVDPVRFNI
jgi:surfactin synthase thioesterase subunit